MPRLTQLSFRCLVCSQRFFEDREFKRHFDGSHVGEEDLKYFQEGQGSGTESEGNGDESKGQRIGEMKRGTQGIEVGAWVPVT
jgi:hypothetical protein